MISIDEIPPLLHAPDRRQAIKAIPVSSLIQSLYANGFGPNCGPDGMTATSRLLGRFPDREVTVALGQLVCYAEQEGVIGHVLCREFGKMTVFVSGRSCAEARGPYQF